MCNINRVTILSYCREILCIYFAQHILICQMVGLLWWSDQYFFPRELLGCSATLDLLFDEKQVTKIRNGLPHSSAALRHTGMCIGWDALYQTDKCTRCWENEKCKSLKRPTQLGVVSQTIYFASRFGVDVSFLPWLDKMVFAGGMMRAFHRVKRLVWAVLKVLHCNCM